MNKTELQELANRIRDNSAFYAAAVAVGFSFEPIFVVVESGSFVPAFYLRMCFECICGKREIVNLCVGQHDIDAGGDAFYLRLDVCRFLYVSGSFSYDHLIKDGYTHKAASDIAERFEAELNRARFPA